jgi:hypothetical protein
VGAAIKIAAAAGRSHSGGAPVFGAVPSLPMQPAVAQETSGLAIASLVCGILGFVTLGLAGLPAVITGHLGLSAIKKSAGRLKGGGMAIAGLIMGYFGFGIIFLAILASLAVPAFTQVQIKGNQMKAVNNAKQLVIGMKQYAVDHDGKLPPTLETLYEEAIVTDRKLLEVPGTNTPEAGWEYRGAGLTDYGDGNAIVLISRESYRRGERVVAHLNHVVQVERGEQVPKTE